MGNFKPGDYVVPVRADRAGCDDDMKKRIGKVLQVFETTESVGEMTVLAGKRQQLGECWFWHPDDLRHATADEIAAATKPKSLRRGDLVDYSGNICMVFDERTSKRGERLIVVLNSKDRMDSFYAYVDDLVCVGSIRKQLKRAKQKKMCELGKRAGQNDN